MKKHNFVNRTTEVTEEKIQRRTFLSFLTFSLASISGVLGWKWLNRQPQEKGALAPLRKTMETNEAILKSTFSNNRLVKTYTPAEAAKKVRINSLVGLNKNLDGEKWRLTAQKQNGSSVSFRLEDIKKLPKQDIVFDFKCVEGWSQIQHWGGVPLASFLKAAHLEEETNYKYVGLQTPDKKYYVGLDMQSALHPQTMLCYEMNGEPLTIEHGYPLRLIVPVKYGIKNLKCIGQMYFSNTKPPDYWAERGYDYYAGL